MPIRHHRDIIRIDSDAKILSCMQPIMADWSINMTLAEYIKEQREAKGLSQRELANASKISNSEISRIERGIRKNVSPDHLKLLAQALDVPAEEMLPFAGKLLFEVSSSVNNSKVIYVDDLSAKEIDEVKKYIRFIKSLR